VTNDTADNCSSDTAGDRLLWPPVPPMAMKETMLAATINDARILIKSTPEKRLNIFAGDYRNRQTAALAILEL